ncbi:hypothetical protein C9374_002350 [Naegleria lovaniensis]|uniref:Nucleoplasmin-like domain-containing protein n=1 Tax=Naegleria lovaniensis TaxID=51637 RepID=A0AA88KMK7_NAELO|nr:uncharacterized protein C9374_002350 [Naegleria lovaniensis]KAG2386606.1 hypothetical protein C9374_002350 [Naegleria lovaniensis]
MSNIFSFFGQEIKTGQPQTFEIPFGEVVLHLSTIALAKDTPKGSITRVYVHTVDDEADNEKDTKFVVCTLVGKEKESVVVDLNFSEDVAFSLETTAGDDVAVHVTGYINLVGEEDEEDEEKNKILRQMLEEEDEDEDDEDFKPDLNESTESATKIEELTDEDEVEPPMGGDEEDDEALDDEVAEIVMTKVTALEEKLGREATDAEIKKILDEVQKKAAQPKQEEKKQPAKQQQQQKQAPKKETPKESPKKQAPKQDESSKKRKQEEAIGNNNNKKNKKNKKKK